MQPPLPELTRPIPHGILRPHQQTLVSGVETQYLKGAHSRVAAFFVRNVSVHHLWWIKRGSFRAGRNLLDGISTPVWSATPTVESGWQKNH